MWNSFYWMRYSLQRLQGCVCKSLSFVAVSKTILNRRQSRRHQMDMDELRTRRKEQAQNENENDTREKKRVQVARPAHHRHPTNILQSHPKSQQSASSQVATFRRRILAILINPRPLRSEGHLSYSPCRLARISFTQSWPEGPLGGRSRESLNCELEHICHLTTRTTEVAGDV